MVGLGLLGSALAERFLHAGAAVTGFDLDPQRRQVLADLGGRPVSEVRAVLPHVDYLVLSLPDSIVVASVLADLARLPPGLVIVDTTTGDPDQTAAFGTELASAGVHYIDATVAGSSTQARNGDVVLMVGGDQAIVDRCSELFRCFARQWFHVGPCGAGARLKLVVNLVLGLNRAVLAEGLSFARACSIEPGLALEVLKAGPAYARVMDSKGRKMIEEDFRCEAKLSQHLKDVRLILAAGEQHNAELPFSAIHELLLIRLEQAGLGDADNSAIIKAFLRAP
jgi:3-hydroxyisobutyrate dehydrogenase-like beta-hydroxyacid dehydrogenase